MAHETGWDGVVAASAPSGPNGTEGVPITLLVEGGKGAAKVLFETD